MLTERADSRTTSLTLMLTERADSRTTSLTLMITERANSRMTVCQTERTDDPRLPDCVQLCALFPVVTSRPSPPPRRLSAAPLAIPVTVAMVTPRRLYLSTPLGWLTTDQHQAGRQAAAEEEGGMVWDFGPNAFTPSGSPRVCASPPWVSLPASYIPHPLRPALRRHNKPSVG
jgi:hypothetical protein